jgi:hypothetical protein
MSRVEEIADRIRQELKLIQPVVEQLTRLRSRWNGQVELITDPGFRGKKLFSCAIVLDAALAENRVRWRTALHEMLHSVSAGYTQADYLALVGWEEGVVEQLQRIIRPAALSQLGILVSEEVFQAAEDHHLFNRHIAALEQMRTALSLPLLDFYLDLLRRPLRDRPAYIFGLGNRLPAARRTAFVKVYSAANAVLKR